MTRHLTLGLAVILLAATSWAQSPPTRTRALSTLELMNQRLPEVRFVEQPLEQVVEWLADFTQMNVVVRWQVLEDSLIMRDAPISLKVRNLRLSQVLWLIMNEAGGSEVTLAYRASGNLLILSTEQDLGRELITKVYDVADLLLRVPRSGRPDFTSQSQGLGQTGGGGGSQNIFGNSQQQRSNQQDDFGSDVQIQALIEIIQNTIEPDSWEVNAGRGQINTLGSLLIVRNTILVHQQLGGYLTEDEVVGP
ncbi:MAG: hypothetical protein KAY37_15585 [Phycisphaerae bacterium]|nr:hypothetical protein [Phycisphaerae bacterium]